MQPLVAPTQTFPPNSVDFKVQEVVLDWDPINGAKSYDVQVAADPGVHQRHRQRVGDRRNALCPGCEP